MAGDEVFSAPRTPRRADNLSDEIVRTVEKWPGDVVRCTHVCGDGYRCNWWAAQSTRAYDNPSMSGLLVTTHRVRKSRFLRATKEGGRLVITEISAS